MEMEFDLTDNLRYKDCIAKYVKVKTADSREHEGWLKCIDPLSGNLFLMSFDDTFSVICDIVLIIGSACTSVEVLKEPDDKIKNLIEGLYTNDASFSEDISDRKNRLIAWIKKNRLPIVEKADQSLTVCGNVTISPPYDIQSCSSTNGRTLKSVRQLVAKLPANISK